MGKYFQYLAVNWTNSFTSSKHLYRSFITCYFITIFIIEHLENEMYLRN